MARVVVDDALMDVIVQGVGMHKVFVDARLKPNDAAKFTHVILGWQVLLGKLCFHLK